jgi:hypothetical protein
LKENTKLEVFESGHSKMGYPFNTAFYENNDIPYSVSFDYFSLPEEGEEDDAMFDHLMETYNISGDYAVVSNEFSGGSFDLKVESKYPLVYLKQSEDFYRNIFFYKKIIRKAKELHLVNSAYFHLAERLPKDGKIHYHNDRGQDFSFYRQDDIVLA